MAVSYFRQASNTFESSVSGGSIPAANKKDVVPFWMQRLAPNDTPLVTLAGYSKPYDQDVMTWGQSYKVPFVTTAAEDLTDSETDLDVAAGTGEYFHQWMVIAITDFDAAGYLDHSTREICVVNAAVSNDTLTIDRGEGGTSNVVHSSGAQVEIIGTALPQNTDFVISPIARGDQVFNYFQRFFGMVQADQAARNMPTWENPTDVLLADAEETGKQLKIQLEKAFYTGGRQRGVTGTPTATLAGGLDTFITTNTTDVGGANLSVYSLEAELRDLWKAVGDNKATKFLMGPDTAAIFDTTLNPYREAGMDTTSATLTFDKVKFRWGTYDLMVSRHCPPGIIYGIRPEHLHVVPFKGCDWQTKEIETGGPYNQKAIWGDFSFRVEAESTMFRLSGFNQNFDNYPRSEWL